MDGHAYFTWPMMDRDESAAARNILARRKTLVVLWVEQLVALKRCFELGAAVMATGRSMQAGGTHYTYWSLVVILVTCCCAHGDTRTWGWPRVFLFRPFHLWRTRRHPALAI